GRPGQRSYSCHRRHGRQLHARGAGADRESQGGGCRCLPAGHPVLQQADPGRPLPALQAYCRVRGDSADSLQRTGSHGLRHVAGDRGAAVQGVEHHRHQGSDGRSQARPGSTRSRRQGFPRLFRRRRHRRRTHTDGRQGQYLRHRERGAPRDERTLHGCSCRRCGDGSGDSRQTDAAASDALHRSEPDSGEVGVARDGPDVGWDSPAIDLAQPAVPGATASGDAPMRCAGLTTPLNGLNNEGTCMKRLAGLSTLALTISATSGCGWLWGDDGYFRDRGSDYLQAHQVAPMQVPADVQLRPVEPLLPIPHQIADARVTGEYEVPRPQKLVVAVEESEFSLQTSDDARWLVAMRAPSQVWSAARQFFTDNGFQIAEDRPQTGEFITAWQTRDQLSPALVRNLGLGQDETRVRVRIEPGVQRNTSEIYLLSVQRPAGST